MNQSIIDFAPSDNPFSVIYVDITHRCQMACANCYLPNRTIDDMNTELLMEMLSKLPVKTDVRLIGGEPTLRIDLPDIIRRIVELGHRPMLITNGLKLSDEKYCQELKAAGLQYVQLSFNGFNDNKIYKIIDNMECAELKISAVKNCEKVGFGISISAIIVKNVNSHLIGEMIDYSKKYLKKPIRLNFRNVGDIGRNMLAVAENVGFEEIVEAVAAHIGVSPDELFRHRTRDNQLRYPFRVGLKRSEVIWIKITDWKNYPKNISDIKSIQAYSIKGRVTQNFRLAPFFDHVTLNQFGY